MTLERDGPGRTLVDGVLETLDSAGWEETELGAFRRTLRRVTFRGKLEDFLGVARRDGIEGLRRFLTRRNRELERASEVNALRERRLARALPDVVDSMLERTVGPRVRREVDGGVEVDAHYVDDEETE